MTDQFDPAEPIVGFNRHPAAIGSKTLLRPVYPAPSPQAAGDGTRDAAARSAATWDPAARFAPPGPSTLQHPMLHALVSLASPPGLSVSAHITRSRIRLSPALGEPEAQQPVEPPPTAPAPEPPAPPALELPAPDPSEAPLPEPVPEAVEAAPELPLHDPLPPETLEAPEPVQVYDSYPAEAPEPVQVYESYPSEEPEPVQVPELQPAPELVAAEALLPRTRRTRVGFLPGRLGRRFQSSVGSDIEPPLPPGFDPRTVFEVPDAAAPEAPEAAAPLAPAEHPAELWPDATPAYADLEPEDEEPWDAKPDTVTTRRRLVRRLPARSLAAVAVLAVLIGLVVATVGVVSSWLNDGSVTALFNAPMMVVRAAVTGRVMVISANAGEIVDPKSPLFTIHTTDPNSPDRSVLADVHGVVRSVETVPGADLTAGTPLVRIHDCDRAFLTVPQTAKLTAGESVRVKLPNYPAVTGTIRASAGIMEPPNSLVVGLAPNAIPGACPVGATAEVTPVPKG